MNIHNHNINPEIDFVDITVNINDKPKTKPMPNIVVKSIKLYYPF